MQKAIKPLNNCLIFCCLIFGLLGCNKEQHPKTYTYKVNQVLCVNGMDDENYKKGCKGDVIKYAGVLNFRLFKDNKILVRVEKQDPTTVYFHRLFKLDNCIIWDIKNWQCIEDGDVYEMREGTYIRVATFYKTAQVYTGNIELIN